MESKKVKEIKKGLECCTNPVYCEKECPYHIYERHLECINELTKDSLTLINELESERSEVAIKNHRLALKNIELLDENQQLKDRIAELEEYIKGNEADAKAFVNGWNKDLQTELTRFAERLKIECVNKIHETLKEFIKGE